MINESDATIREQVLNTENSYIVQAPAGSGKTTLLVQRYLALLAKVNYPEEIIAITFTQKAATEMKNRITEALENAEQCNISTIFEPHKIKIFKLANAALQRNHEQQWSLLENPTRLRVQTIDSLCSSITKQLPLLSELVYEPNILDAIQAEKYYSLAVHNILESYDDATLNNFYLEKLENILFYLDNDRTKIENLFIEMLKRRDQWLSHFLNLRNLKQQQPNKLRCILENSLKKITNETIKNFKICLPTNLKDEIEFLINSALNNLQNSEKNSDFLQVLDFTDIFHNMNSTNNYVNLNNLQLIAKIFLTDKLEWRKTINKNQGFPAKSPFKKRMEDLLTMLASHEDFRISLTEIIQCPAPAYTEQQWDIISSLLELLPLLVAQLKILFTENKIADFTEIAMAANTALGSEESPSELALNLDTKIKHLLVDEFQDTSISQYRLLEKLTAGWEENDGRTLFLVGDPMQSIYRFRQAEVGLFLRAQHEGIGNIKLQSLTLSVNYRSHKNIIDWLNDTFVKILPKNHNAIYGAVTFNKAETATTEDNDTSVVKIHTLSNTTDLVEANYIINLIKQIKINQPQQTIAILGRSRAHFINIIALLKKENLNYCATELETLSQNQTIQDLFALTKAIYDLHDNIAWLAILRAPWCGLSLSDLHALSVKTADDKKVESILFENLFNRKNFTQLSKDGLIALERCLPHIIAGVQNKEKQSLRETVEKTWRLLGGPACLENKNELEIADVYFELLETYDHNDNTIDVDLLENNLQKLYANSQMNSITDIQIMTIHKAKGLEFDNVFVVGLEREVKNDAKKLMLWLELPQKHKGTDFLLAPINTTDDESDSIYDYLKNTEAKKSYYEIGRLLYVATTRAKKNLHLIGKINSKDDTPDEFHKPAKNSFLEQLWPLFTHKWITDGNNEAISAPVISDNNQLTKLTAAWTHPLIMEEKKNKIVILNKKNSTSNNYFYKWQDDSATTLGLVAHQCLQQLCHDQAQQEIINISNYIELNKKYWRKLLLENGCVIQTALHLEKIIRAIKNIFNDPKGKWIIKNHKNANNEYEITAVLDGKIKHFIIDRTFVDENDNRWIIDYKTSVPKDSDLNAFIELEFQHYKKQLEDYARALSNTENRKIFLGLYFPLCAIWKEWRPMLST